MFFDVFSDLCGKAGISTYKACIEMGLNRSVVAKWKTGATPNGATLSKIADYFGVSVDCLLGNEKAPALEGEREIGFDDFTYAMQNETKTLTDGDKELLLSLARQLNDARKKKNGESD